MNNPVDQNAVDVSAVSAAASQEQINGLLEQKSPYSDGEPSEAVTAIAEPTKTNVNKSSNELPNRTDDGVPPKRSEPHQNSSTTASSVASPSRESATDESEAAIEERRIEHQLELEKFGQREVLEAAEEDLDLVADEDALVGTDQISLVQQPVFPTNMQARQSGEQVSRPSSSHVWRV